MMTYTIKNAMMVYGELVKCYYGTNTYDSDTAEIYAYILTQRSPGYQHPDKRGKVSGAWYDQEDIDSATNLKDIIEIFLKQFSLTWDNIEIDGFSGTSEEVEKFWKEGFSHRVHVKVINDRR